MSKEVGYCHCPVCKHWVPEQFMLHEWDDVDKILIRMCFNCAHELGDTELPTFKHEDFRYDPEFGLIKCPLCGHKSEDTFEYDSRAKPGDANYRKWHCGHCGKDFRWFG